VRKILVCKIIILFIIFISENEAKPEVLKSDTNIAGSVFPKGTHVEYYPSGKVAYINSDENREINGIVFEKCHPIIFFESGAIYEGRLAEDIKIDGITFMQDTDIMFYDTGKINIGTLGQDHGIQGMKFIKGTRICFDESGTLYDVLLSKEQNIRGIYCANDYVDFYKSGKIKRAKLAKDHEIQGINFSEGSWIWLTESEKPELAELGRAQTIQGKAYNKGDNISFNEKGMAKPANFIIVPAN
jgi:antitoxin component YwqK of YwqJK toxin-antitoxin module